MQGLPLAILGDQRELARLPEGSVSNPTLAFSLFVNAAKGLSSLQLSRNLGVQVKPAFVLLHKLSRPLSIITALTTSGAPSRSPPGAVCRVAGPFFLFPRIRLACRVITKTTTAKFRSGIRPAR
jgi:hypothetical protein